MILTIRPATVADAAWMGQNLRADDWREVETASGRPAAEVVPESLGLSAECYTIRLARQNGSIENLPTVIFGIANSPTEGVGVVWLLATSGIHRAPLSIIREAPKWLDHFNTLYPLGITNIVDTRNDLHLRWLALTGFEFGDVYQVNGHPFVQATRYTRET